LSGRAIPGWPYIGNFSVGSLWAAAQLAGKTVTDAASINTRIAAEPQPRESTRRARRKKNLTAKSAKEAKEKCFELGVLGALARVNLRVRELLTSKSMRKLRKLLSIVEKALSSFALRS
jgi:hypothetical protein